MGLTFITRKYNCIKCGHSGSACSVMRNHTDIITYFTEADRPSELREDRLYKEILTRDEIGLIVERKIVEYTCDKCGTVEIGPESWSKYETVSNFYPPSEAGKWFDGFARHLG